MRKFLKWTQQWRRLIRTHSFECWRAALSKPRESVVVNVVAVSVDVPQYDTPVAKPNTSVHDAVQKSLQGIQYSLDALHRSGRHCYKHNSITASNYYL